MCAYVHMCTCISMNWIQSVLSLHTWVEHPLEHDNPPVTTLVKKTNSPSWSRHQLSVVSQLGVEAWVPLPHPFWNSGWPDLVQRATLPNPGEQWPLHIQKTVSSLVVLISNSYDLSVSSSSWCPLSLWGRDMVSMPHSWLSTLKTFTFRVLRSRESLR